MPLSSLARMQQRRPGGHRGVRVEHRGQDLVVHDDGPAAGLRGSHGLGDRRRPPAGPGTARPGPAAGCRSGRRCSGGAGRSNRGPAERIVRAENSHDARNGQRRRCVERPDPRVRVGGSDEYEVEQSRCTGCVEGEPRLPGHHSPAGRDADIGTHGLCERAAVAGRPAPAGARAPGLLRPPDPAHAVHRVRDGGVSRAAADVALERRGQIRPLRIVEGGGRHDHARGTEAALEPLGVAERLLDRMELAVGPADQATQPLRSWSPRGRARAGPGRGSCGPAGRRRGRCTRRSPRRHSPS